MGESGVGQVGGAGPSKGGAEERRTGRLGAFTAAADRLAANKAAEPQGQRHHRVGESVRQSGRWSRNGERWNGPSGPVSASVCVGLKDGGGMASAGHWFTGHKTPAQRGKDQEGP
jgi:hypothetical protein